ncbi:transposase [Streptomyces sp. NPDC001975]
MEERPLVRSLGLEQSADAALGILSRFRIQFYDCLHTRAEALFELTDAVLCSDGPVTSLVELTLTAEYRRGHGATYDAVNHGWSEPRRLRRLQASTPLPRSADGVDRARGECEQRKPFGERGGGPFVTGFVSVAARLVGAAPGVVGTPAETVQSGLRRVTLAPPPDGQYRSRTGT